MNTTKDSFANERSILYGTFVAGFLWCLYRLFANESWILDDEPTHWYFSRSVWEQFDNLFNNWTRFGRNLIHSPVSILGFTATRVYTLLLAGLAVVLTYKSAKILHLRAACFIPLLMFFQEWFPDLSYSILTQTPTLLVWVLGIYWALKERLNLAACAFGYLSLIRHEAILVTFIWGLWVTCTPGGFIHGLFNKQKEESSHAKRFWRDLKVAFFTVLPIVIYNALAFVFTKNIPFLIYFDSKPTDHYGSGSIWHYPFLLFSWLGIVSFTLSAIGILTLRKKDCHFWSLILLTYFGYFSAQTIIFWKGLFASGGYYHFIMPMAPVFALLGCKAIDFIATKKHGKKLVTIIAFCVLFQGLNLKSHQLYHQNWDAIMVANQKQEFHCIAPPLRADESRVHLMDAAEFTHEYKEEDQQVVSNFAMTAAQFKNFGTKEYREIRFTPVNNMNKGTLFIWDCKMSELSETEKLANFDEDKWQIVKKWEKTYLTEESKAQNPERVFNVILLEKTK